MDLKNAGAILLLGGGVFTLFFPWRFDTKVRRALLHLPLLIVPLWMRGQQMISPFCFLIVVAYLIKLLVFAFKAPSTRY
jgi:hypothetical protein